MSSHVSKRVYDRLEVKEAALTARVLRRLPGASRNFQGVLRGSQRLAGAPRGSQGFPGSWKAPRTRGFEEAPRGSQGVQEPYKTFNWIVGVRGQSGKKRTFSKGRVSP